MNNTLIDFLKRNALWSVQNDKLFRQIKTESWTQAMAIANMISYFAESYDHHPDLLISYTKIEILLFTHDKKTVSEKDIQLAQKIEDSLIFN